MNGGVGLNKNTLKYLIDVTIFIDICSVAVTGLLLGFIIPKGKGTDKNFLSLHRHEWSEIHLYLALFLVVLLFFHVWFNWSWIVNSTKRYFGENWKNVLWGFSVGWIIVLFIGWLAIKFS